MPKHILSKSTFLRSIRCAKSLYLNKYYKDLRDPITEGQQALFDQGTSVGKMAWKMWPGGKDASPAQYWDFGPSLEKTRQWIEEGETVIYEAAFQYDGVLAAVDILAHENDVWNAYEIKSSTAVDENHIWDAAIQYYVMRENGMEPHDIFIGVINNQYVLGDELDVQELFTLESVKEQVMELLPSLPRLIQEAKEVLQQSEVPDIDIGPYCTKPYDCDFIGHCWAHVPQDSVFNLSNAGNKSWELYKQGIWVLHEIPEDFPLSDNQRLQVEAWKTGDPFIDKNAIRDFLATLNYPMYFMDFETFMTAVPFFKGTRPYQQIPFQYSVHFKKDATTAPEHHEFLAETDGSDPRIDFIEGLLRTIGEEGDVLVYNQSFELRILKELQEAFPEYAAGLQSIMDRVKDLMLPFQQKMYYTPGMMGSHSIKKVLPELVPELNYKGLDIAEGTAASRMYVRMLQGDDNLNYTKAKQDLLAYCQMDTLAMVRILEQLEKVE